MTPRAVRRLRIVLIVLVALLICVELFLRFGLTRIVREAAIPPAEEALGVDVELENVMASIFGGVGNASGLMAANPEGFDGSALATVPVIDMDLGLFSLLSGVLHLVKMEADDIVITVVRNKEGEINAQKLYETLEALTEAEGEKPKRKTGRKKEKKAPVKDLPMSKVGKARLSMTIAYVDHQLGDSPLRLAWKLKAEAENLRTYGDLDDDWGTFSVTGHLEDRPDAFVTNIRGRVAPMPDPTHANFEVTGGIREIKLGEMKALADELGITAQSVSVELKIRCRDGKFRRTESEITLRFKKPRMVGKLARKFSSIPLPADLSVTLPFKGNIESFREDWPMAIVKTITSNAANNIAKPIDRTIKKATVDQRGLERIFLDRLFGRKKKPKT